MTRDSLFIDLRINKEGLAHNIQKAKEINIKIAKNYLMYSKWYTEEE